MEIAAESSISTYFYCISIGIQLVKTTKNSYYHFLKNSLGLNLNYFLVLGSLYLVLRTLYFKLFVIIRFFTTNQRKKEVQLGELWTVDSQLLTIIRIYKLEN